MVLLCPSSLCVSLRLLRGNKSCSVEDSEDCKDNSVEKDYCSDSKKEVGVLGHLYRQMFHYYA